MLSYNYHSVSPDDDILHNHVKTKKLALVHDSTTDYLNWMSFSTNVLLLFQDPAYFAIRFPYSLIFDSFSAFPVFHDLDSFEKYWSGFW